MVLVGVKLGSPHTQGGVVVVVAAPGVVVVVLVVSQLSSSSSHNADVSFQTHLHRPEQVGAGWGWDVVVVSSVSSAGPET